jgi:drug/metabolite transporter (DMT)-like permease
MKHLSPHLTAVLQALFVTFLWSTSWVLIKFGLVDIPALTFAGLRYGLAFLCLLPLTFRAAHLTTLRRLTGQDWLRLSALGLLFYTATQGAQFLGLAYLPANTVNLLLNFTPAIVTLFGIFLLAESPTPLQWSGISLSLVGTVIYFYPATIPTDQVFGLIVVMAGVLANAGSAVLGRQVNRAGNLSPLLITWVSMGSGSIVLLLTGISIQGFPPLSLTNWIIVGWLAIVNTAFAFTLWNLTLRTLSAMESSLINGAMLIQIPVLAWFFLGEAITWREGMGLALAGVGIVLVQLRGRR